LKYDGKIDRSGNFSPSLSQLHYYVSVLQPEQRTLVDEKGMVKTKMGSTTYQKTAAVAWDA
jgi:hypothetical protein